MDNILVLNASDVRAALPMQAAVEAMKTAYAALSAGDSRVPLRTHLPVEPAGSSALFMPAFVASEEGSSLAVKVVTLFPGNVPKGMPLIHAAVLVLDAETGRILALLEGGALTAIRTGAGSGAATDLLARPDAGTAAVIGAGVQAETQLEAVCAVRPIREARIFSRTPQRVEAFIRSMAERVAADLVAAASPAAALDGADVICTATTSHEPVFEDGNIGAGAHINAVGSYTAQMIEIPPQTIARSLVTVDSRAACAEEAGELIHAQTLGLLQAGDISEIGEIILGESRGRTAADQVTLFKSVGVAVQDAVAGRLALENALALGLGTRVGW